MALEKLSLESICALDGGRIRTSFEQAVARCEADLKDRPGVRTARKVTLVLTLVPLADETGALESCNLQFKVIDQQPKRESKTYNAAASRGGLMFNELSSNDVRQMTIDQAPKPRSTANAG